MNLSCSDRISQDRIRQRTEREKNPRTTFKFAENNRGIVAIDPSTKTTR